MKKNSNIEGSDDEKDNKLGVDDYMLEMADEEDRIEEENDE